jgi:hypothetical protein
MAEATGPGNDLANTLAKRQAKPAEGGQLAGTDAWQTAVTIDSNHQGQALGRELGDNAAVGTVAEAITCGDMVAFAILSGAMDETIQARAPAPNGKVTVEAANRLGSAVMHSEAAFSTHAPAARL